jgi:hypothetical protein
MTLRKNAPRSKGRWMVLGVAVTACMLLVAGLAFAGPVGLASGFEDDDANLLDNAAAGIDWNNFQDVDWTPTPATTPTRTADKVLSGWTFKGIEDWAATTADSGFAGGTKQDDDCPSVISAKAPNKDDLKRIYLSSKTGANGHTYLNLAWVRIPQNTTSPSAHIGFEFNKANNGACAGPGGLVKRSAGDILVVYDFEGGGTPILTLRKWVLTGACDVASNSAPCWGVAVNLTASGFAEGAVNTGSTVLDQLAPPALNAATGTSVDATLGLSEFGEAGIDLTDAGVFTAGTCNSFGKAYGVSRSSGNSGTAQMKDLVGPANFNLTNCGTVTIIKRTSPRDLNQNFSYTSTLAGTCSTDTTPASFTLNDNGTGDTTGNTETCTDVPTGNYTVTEGADPAGFTFTDLSCTASGTGTSATPASGSGTRIASITMAGGGSVTCVYTNTQQLGALRIDKDSSKTGNLVTTEGAVFTITPSGGTAFDVTDDTTAAPPDEDATIGEVCVTGLVAGSYTVSEKTPPTGYSRDSGAAQNYTVVSGSTCSTATAVTFTDTPLGDLTVTWTDGGSNETGADIVCDEGTLDPADSTPGAFDDDSEIYQDIPGGTSANPNVITCTIRVDP